MDTLQIKILVAVVVGVLILVQKFRKRLEL